MAVQVDIPGFGVVEAKNAAEESTMKEILRALQGKGGKSSGGGSGGGGGAAGQSGFAGVLENASKKMGPFSDGIKNSTTALQDFSRGLKLIGGLVSGAFGAVVSSAQGLAMEFIAGGNRMSDFLQHVPLVGNALGGLTQLLEGQVDNFRDLSEVGAGFGNSILELTKSATGAGMGVAQFSEFVGQNSQNMMLLGGTITEGANRFGQLTRQIRTSNKDFQGMGFTFEALNEHTVEYMEQLAMQGRLSGMSQSELRSGTEDYLVQIDRLAKVTGKSRKEAEALLKQQNAEANVLAMKMKLEGQQLKNFENNMAFVDSQLPGMANAIKDLADGVAQTPLGQKIASIMPEFAELQEQMGKGNVSQEEYAKRMAEMGPKLREFIAGMDPAMVQSLMGKDGFEGLLASTAELSKVEAKYKNADFKKMEEEAKKRDETTKQLANFETSIAEMRAKIMQTLIDSGVLDKLNKAFGDMLKWFDDNADDLTGSLSKVMEDVTKYAMDFAKFLKDTWEASNGDLGKFFSTVWEQKFKPMISRAFASLGETFKNWFGEFFKEHIGTLIVGTLGALAGILVTKLITGMLTTLLGIIVGPIIAPFLAIGGALLAIFGWETIKGWVGGAWDAIVGVFTWISDKFSWIWDKVKVVVGAIWDVYAGLFGWIGDMFGWIWEKIKPIVSGIWNVVGGVFGWIGDIFTWIWDKVKTPIMAVYNAISTMFGWIGDTVGWIYNKIKMLNPFNWFGSDDDEDTAEKKIAETKSEVTGIPLTEEEKRKLGVDPASAMVEKKQLESLPDMGTTTGNVPGLGTGMETASVNTNGMNSAIAELLVEQNQLLKKQISAIKALQGNLLKGIG